MANTYPDDVALLKQELAQFLLSEIASAQGATTFRREVGEQVAAVIDQILAERLKPTLENLERQAADHAGRTTAMVEEALQRLKAAAPDSKVSDSRVADLAAQLDELRQRLARAEDAAKPPRGPAATAQPLRAAGRAESKPADPTLSDERIAAPPTTASFIPRWMLLLLLLLVALTVLGLGNLYYERLTAPAVSAAPVPTVAPPPATHAQVPSPHPQTAAVVPPPTPAAIAPVTTTPVTTAPLSAPPLATAPVTAPPPQPRSRIPADFAIERGWLAAQPYAVEPRLARRVGSNDSLPTLRSVVCGSAPNCASDALMSDSVGGKQLIALQMLMAQIGDRFCTPRRSVAVSGLVSAAGLADLAAIARCAGGAPSTCSETQNRVCAPDSDALQSGSQAARAALLRWALWKTGST